LEICAIQLETKSANLPNVSKISDINTGINSAPLKRKFRKIYIETVAYFQCLLANDTWEEVSKNWDTDSKFNFFLDPFLKIFEASFPVQN
jgi:hypothetical protein